MWRRMVALGCVVGLMGCSGGGGDSSVAVSVVSVPVGSVSVGTGSTVPVGVSVEVVAAGAWLGSPGDVVLPVASGDVAVFLVGEGAVVVEMVKALAPLWAEGVGACGSVVGVLEGLGSPEELLAAASGIPDAPTREMLVTLHGLAVELLRSCGEAAVFESFVSGFAWQWALADRRLTELGV